MKIPAALLMVLALICPAPASAGEPPEVMGKLFSCARLIDFARQETREDYLKCAAPLFDPDLPEKVRLRFALWAATSPRVGDFTACAADRVQWAKLGGRDADVLLCFDAAEGTGVKKGYVFLIKRGDVLLIRDIRY